MWEGTMTYYNKIRPRQGVTLPWTPQKLLNMYKTLTQEKGGVSQTKQKNDFKQIYTSMEECIAISVRF